MSTIVQSQGFIAILVNPVPQDQRSDVHEKLYDETDGFIQISEDGMLVFSDDFAKKKYSEREFNGDLFIVGKLDASSDMAGFVEAALKAGLPVNPASIEPYTCVWYNGSDSPMSLLTLEEFQNKQEG